MYEQKLTLDSKLAEICEEPYIKKDLKIEDVMFVHLQ